MHPFHLRGGWAPFLLLSRRTVKRPLASRKIHTAHRSRCEVRAMATRLSSTRQRGFGGINEWHSPPRGNDYKSKQRSRHLRNQTDPAHVGGVLAPHQFGNQNRTHRPSLLNPRTAKRSKISLDWALGHGLFTHGVGRPLTPAPYLACSHNKRVSGHPAPSFLPLFG